jgi:hypothetical protein
MERRMVAMEEFIKTMLVTYQINNVYGTMYDYTANIQNYIDIFSIKFLSKNSTGIYIELDKYTYNTLYGSISIINKQGQILYNLKRNDFDTLTYTAHILTADISENNFDIIASLNDTKGVGLKTIRLSYVNFLTQLPIAN